MTEKRYSSHFKCPHCQSVIEKPTSYQLFAGARGVGFASSPHDTCPYCGKQINRIEIIDGTYDYWPGGKGGGVAIWVIVAIVVIFFIVKSC